MEEQEKFFVSESMRHAKSLPFSECLTFVTGMIAAVGNDHPAIPRLRRLQNSLLDSDQQIDLIQIGQLKLNLAAAQARRRR